MLFIFVEELISLNLTFALICINCFENVGIVTSTVFMLRARGGGGSQYLQLRILNTRGPRGTDVNKVYSTRKLIISECKIQKRNDFTELSYSSCLYSCSKKALKKIFFVFFCLCCT